MDAPSVAPSTEVAGTLRAWALTQSSFPGTGCLMVGVPVGPLLGAVVGMEGAAEGVTLGLFVGSLLGLDDGDRVSQRATHLLL